VPSDAIQFSEFDRKPALVSAATGIDARLRTAMSTSSVVRGSG